MIIELILKKFFLRSQEKGRTQEAGGFGLLYEEEGKENV
jgi:hypothetical protein